MAPARFALAAKKKEQRPKSWRNPRRRHQKRPHRRRRLKRQSPARKQKSWASIGRFRWWHLCLSSLVA